MAFSVSPGIVIQEIDATTSVPAVSTTEAGIAGVFEWGPVDKVVLISSENDLVRFYGKPSDFAPETWFSAASFLAYSNQLYVNRVTSNAYSAVANTGSANLDLHIVKNEDDYQVKKTSFGANVQFVAKYPGAKGNALKISVCDSAAQYESAIDLHAAVASNTSFADANTKFTISVGSSTGTFSFSNTAALTGNTPEPYVANVVSKLSVGDYVQVGNSSIGTQYLKVKAISNVAIANTAGANTGKASFTVTFDDRYKLSTDFSANNVTRKWEFFNSVDTAPGQSNYVASVGNTAAQDELHMVLVDEDGAFAAPGTILEIYEGLSRASDARREDGASLYYKKVLENSRYVWAGTDLSGAVTNTAVNVVSSTRTTPYVASFVGGTNGAGEANVSVATLALGYDKYKDAENIDVSLLITGKSLGGTHGEQLGNYIIDNITEVRKDCVVFISPAKEDVVNNLVDPAQDVVEFFNSVRSTSYAMFDSGYKYMYDKYNDVFRWVPLNADIAGLCVNTDNVRDPWFSPAGFNRGNIKNVTKLAFNPNKAERDLLYRNRVNPVTTFKGSGAILYGDKTGLNKSSAFDRINVRRLFIVLEKAIAKAAQSSLFEFNDEFTRAQFRNLVEPFLRDVQGRRGIYDFRVVCDTTNNTPEVIDGNRFVGDIYIKPARSINEIRLNFIAVRTEATFEEIAGQF